MLAGIALAGCLGTDAPPDSDEPLTGPGGNAASATHARTPAAPSASQVLASVNAAALVASRPGFLQATASEAFVQGHVLSSDGTHYVPYERTYAGLRVVGGDFVVVMDGAGRNVYNSIALQRPIGLASVTPVLSQAAAEKIATARLRSVTGVEGTELVVHALDTTPRLAWESTIDGVGDSGVSRLTVDVDAITGAVLREQEHVMTGVGTSAWSGPNPVSIATTQGTTFLMRDPTITNLSCQDAASNTVFSGPDDLWGNGNATNRETGCVDALFGAQTEARMLSQWLGRNAMDGAGGAWPIRVGLNQQNAFYDGTQVQIGHNSAGQWIGSVDVIAHEMGHGIDDHTPGGISRGGTQEFVADAFGAATETFANEPAPFDVPDFLVGEQINLSGNGPIRNMFNPSALGDPNCFSSSIPNTEVHAAAGPGNHWFYLLAEGSNPTNGQPTSPTCNNLPVFGIGVPNAIKILYNAMLMKTSASSYPKYRTWTLQAAKNLFPGSCRRFDAVKAAWNAVNVPAQPDEPTCTLQRPAPSSDILWRNLNTGLLVEWLMSDGEIGATVNLFNEPVEWQVQATGDFNGDGTSDILFRNTTTGLFVEWLMSNGQVAAVVTLFNEPAEWQVQGIGDFNGDGISDILWENVNTGQFAEWLMSNTGGVGSVITLFTEPLEWKVQGIGDFNGDGTSDVLWENIKTGEFVEWLMSNGGVGAVINLFTEPLEWHVQGIGDFNGDGTSDVLWRNVNTGEFVEWFMSNGGVGDTAQLFTEPPEWQVQRIGNFDGR